MRSSSSRTRRSARSRRQAVAAAGEQDQVAGVRQQHRPGDVALLARVGVGDELVEGAVAAARGGDRDEGVDLVVEAHRQGGADERLDAVLARRPGRLGAAGDVERVGERQRSVAELGGAAHQGGGAGGTPAPKEKVEWLQSSTFSR
jgi:hypothetical protein